jgi:sugar lactone lactonase YvrE
MVRVKNSTPVSMSGVCAGNEAMTRRVALAGILWLVTLAAADEPNRSLEQSRKLAEQIDQLIRQLDDDSFSIREQASRRLAGIGKPALGALQEAAKSSSAEVQFRARALIELMQRFRLYTVSHEGHLFRIDVGKMHLKTSLLAKLGEPFEKPNVRVEGLAMAPDGVLYASAVFDAKAEPQSRLYRIDPRTGVATFVGEIVAMQVDGLDFGPDGKLYGAISSGSKARAVGLRQIVSIDIRTGKPISTATEVTFGDVDALAFSPTGEVFVTSGCSGLFSVNPLRKNERASVLDDVRFQRYLRVNGDIEGMCMTDDGSIFGLCRKNRTTFVRVDPKSGRVTELGHLPFAAQCLTR